MLTAAHFCRIAGEKQTKQLERRQKKRIVQRQSSSNAVIEVTRLTPTPIVGFKKIFVFAGSFLVLFVSYFGRQNLVIKAICLFLCLGWSVCVGHTTSFGDKLASVTYRLFSVHILLLAQFSPAHAWRGQTRKWNSDWCYTHTVFAHGV